MFQVGDSVRIKDDLNVPEEFRDKIGTVTHVEDRPIYHDLTRQWVTVTVEDGGTTRLTRLIDSEVEKVEFRGRVEITNELGPDVLGVAIEDFEPVAKGDDGQWHVVKAECPE